MLNGKLLTWLQYSQVLFRIWAKNQQSNQILCFRYFTGNGRKLSFYYMSEPTTKDIGVLEILNDKWKYELEQSSF